MGVKRLSKLDYRAGHVQHSMREADGSGGFSDQWRTYRERAWFGHVPGIYSDLAPGAPNRTAWFGHPPRIQQLGQALLGQDLLFPRNLPHRLA